MAGLIHVPVENIGDLEVLATGGPGPPYLNRPCVTCGLRTGNFCDGQEFHEGVRAYGPPCLGADRVLPKLGGTARGHRFVLDANKCSANVVFAVVSSAQLRRRTAPDRSEWTSGAPLLRDSNRV